MIEEIYGAGFCAHGINPASCMKCDFEKHKLADIEEDLLTQEELYG